MKKDNTVFNDLQASLKQAVAIRQGKMPPSRVFKVETVDVKATREKRTCLKRNSPKPSTSVSARCRTGSKGTAIRRALPWRF